jgi:hypothetical protein
MQHRVHLTTGEFTHPTATSSAATTPGERKPQNIVSRTTSGRLRAHLFAALAIGAVAVLAHALLHRPLLHSDDWYMGVQRLLLGSAQWLDWSDRRPLHAAPYLLLFHLFGVKPAAYSFYLLALHVADAFLIYLIALRFPLRAGWWFALAVALLYLVHPAVYAHMWISMLQGYTGLTLALAAMYLLLRFCDGRRRADWWLYALAHVCLLVSLGMYEIQLGLAGLWILLLAVYARDAPRTRRLALLGLLPLLALFAVWRTAGHALISGSDSYLELAARDPVLLLERLLKGMRIVLVTSWPNALWQLAGGAVSKQAAMLGLAAAVGLSGTLAWAATRGPRQAGRPRLHWAPGAGGYAVALALGLAMAAAGYLPVITLYLPTLAGVDTRVHIVAAIGASVALASLLMLAALLVSANGRQARAVFTAMVLPLLVAAGAVQLQIKEDHVQAWQEQKAIWRQVLADAPAFKAGTSLLIVLRGGHYPHGTEEWRRLPLASWWEVRDGARVLYGDISLDGNLLYPEMEVFLESAVTPAGVRHAESRGVTPYAQVVAYIYERNPAGGRGQGGSLRRLDRLPAAWVEGATGPVVLCGDCVVPRQGPPPAVRALVE